MSNKAKFSMQEQFLNEQMIQLCSYNTARKVYTEILKELQIPIEEIEVIIDFCPTLNLAINTRDRDSFVLNCPASSKSIDCIIHFFNLYYEK